MVGDGGTAMEAEHHPGTHGYAHDHLICIQHQANPWVQADRIQVPRVAAAVHLPSIPDLTGPNPFRRAALPYSRAPPLV
jgi:hypothetical protein